MGKGRYRALKHAEGEALERNGCRCADWKNVRVSEEFDAGRVSRVRFEGKVEIGSLDGTVDDDGVERNCGIRDAVLRNVTVEGGCLISRVHGALENVEVSEGAVIENVGTISSSGESAFGNGSRVEVVNEGGGREIGIAEDLSAQAAYLAAMYRGDGELTERLNGMAREAAKVQRGRRARIGKSARVKDCGEIRDVKIGDFARVEGAGRLANGTIVSAENAVSRVGRGVVAENFIFQKGSIVDTGSMVTSCLVGEGTRIGRQFSAENSVFFANCEGFHSEVCSVFAGPYSVTHHRSTLLIAGLFSFYNAGSGTNQSNHMYKLGPVHQGVVERGCKTGSFSYLLWPARVGAFSVVMGKHYGNFDTSDFPFSYIDEDEGKSMLVPGMNYFTVGTFRDAAKWPARDRRTWEDKLDTLVFEVLSPYTAQKMIRGRDILKELYAKSSKESEFVNVSGIFIKRLLLRTCARYYKLILDRYFGDVLVKRLREKGAESVRADLAGKAGGGNGTGEWIDAAGLICPKAGIDDIVKRVKSGEIEDYRQIADAFRAVRAAYADDEWRWFRSVYRGGGTGEAGAGLKDILEAWKKSSRKLLNMVEADARKEYEDSARVGYGVDGAADEDFKSVRGTFEEDGFVTDLNAEKEHIERAYNETCALLEVK
ncbi:MAG: DUF4954 family protein [Kiritimatiellia bacterium]